MRYELWRVRKKNGGVIKEIVKKRNLSGKKTKPNERWVRQIREILTETCHYLLLLFCFQQFSWCVEKVSEQLNRLIECLTQRKNAAVMKQNGESCSWKFRCILLSMDCFSMDSKAIWAYIYTHEGNLFDAWTFFIRSKIWAQNCWTNDFRVKKWHTNTYKQLNNWKTPIEFIALYIGEIEKKTKKIDRV